MTNGSRAEQRFAAAADEEMLYGIVAEELARNQVSAGLYTKALSDADGDEQKARGRYIKLRVDMLVAERAARQERTLKDLAQTKAEAIAAERATNPSYGHRVMNDLSGAVRGFRDGLKAGDEENRLAEAEEEARRRAAIEALPLKKKGLIALLVTSFTMVMLVFVAYIYEPGVTLIYGFGHGTNLTWLFWLVAIGSFIFWADIVRLYIKLLLRK